MSFKLFPLEILFIGNKVLYLRSETKIILIITKKIDAT